MILRRLEKGPMLKSAGQPHCYLHQIQHLGACSTRMRTCRSVEVPLVAGTHCPDDGWAALGSALNTVHAVPLLRRGACLCGVVASKIPTSRRYGGCSAYRPRAHVHPEAACVPGALRRRLHAQVAVCMHGNHPWAFDSTYVKSGAHPPIITWPTRGKVLNV